MNLKTKSKRDEARQIRAPEIATESDRAALVTYGIILPEHIRKERVNGKLTYHVDCLHCGNTRKLSRVSRVDLAPTRAHQVGYRLISGRVLCPKCAKSAEQSVEPPGLTSGPDGEACLTGDDQPATKIPTTKDPQVPPVGETAPTTGSRAEDDDGGANLHAQNDSPSDSGDELVPSAEQSDHAQTTSDESQPKDTPNETDPTDASSPDDDGDGPTGDDGPSAPGLLPMGTTNPNPHTPADLGITEVVARLNEPMPTEEDDRAAKERFIARQRGAEEVVSKWTAKFMRRIGLVLIELKAEIGHGKWENYVEEAYHAGRIPFEKRSAVDYMAIARETTDEEVDGHNAADILVKLGRTVSRDTQVIEETTKTLKNMWKSALKLGQSGGSLMSAVRKSRDPNSIDVLLKIIEEIRLSLDSLIFDLKEKKSRAEEWIENHPANMKVKP